MQAAMYVRKFSHYIYCRDSAFVFDLENIVPDKSLRCWRKIRNTEGLSISSITIRHLTFLVKAAVYIPSPIKPSHGAAYSNSHHPATEARNSDNLARPRRFFLLLPTMHNRSNSDAWQLRRMPVQHLRAYWTVFLLLSIRR